MNQSQEATHQTSQIILQKDTHDESSKTFTTNSRTNQSNKSDATTGSNAKKEAKHG